MKRAFPGRKSFWEKVKLKLDPHLGFEQWAGKEGAVARERTIQVRDGVPDKKIRKHSAHTGETNNIVWSKGRE